MTEGTNEYAAQCLKFTRLKFTSAGAMNVKRWKEAETV